MVQEKNSTDDPSRYLKFEPGSEAIVEELVREHLGWATSIAKAVARAWNMDWQLDGLDGGAYEALMFCSRRYDPSMGVPFRGYARRRIHEACTEEARKSKAWQRSTGSDTQAEQDARELSLKLFDVFPELREGLLPASEDTDSEDGAMRSSIRQLLAGASLLTAFEASTTENPENLIEYKRLIEIMASLDPVHQSIVWAVYYQGQSMRSLAEEWEIDDLSIIREHKEILSFLCEQFESPQARATKKLKVRRGLRTMAQQLRKNRDDGPFSKFKIPASAARAFILLILAHGGLQLW